MNLLFPFVFVPPRAPRSPAVPTFSTKEQFPLSLGHKRARVVQSRDQLCEHRDMVLHHLSLLGLQFNWEKSKLSRAEDLFSQYGVGIGQPDSATHRGACPVSVELPEFVQRQDSGPTETYSETPGAYGSHSNAAWVASYEAASALASRASPEMGVAERHAPGGHHPVLLPNLQPVVRPFVSTGGSPPRTSVQACCGIHGCLCHRLGGPHTTGMQCRVCGWDLNCISTSTASSC